MLICDMMVATAPIWTVAARQTDSVLRELMRCSKISSDFFHEDHHGLIKACFQCDNVTYCENCFWMSPSASAELAKLKSQ